MVSEPCIRSGKRYCTFSFEIIANLRNCMFRGDGDQQGYHFSMGLERLTLLEAFVIAGNVKLWEFPRQSRRAKAIALKPGSYFYS